MAQLDEAGTLDQFEQLLPDRDVERIEMTLRARYPFIPDNTGFATYIQPKGFAKIDGVDTILPEQAVFLVSTPHPTQPKAAAILSRGVIELTAWREIEKKAIHSSDGVNGDAQRIFGALLRENYARWRDASELIS